MPENEKPKPEKKQTEQTPFERFADLAKRLLSVPKSEIPPEKWSKQSPKPD